MLIGELLIRKKLVTKRELEIALDEQKNTGEFLGSVLLKRKYLKEEDLMKVLSEIFGVPFMSLTDKYIDWKLAMSFSPSLVVERRCLPFRENDHGIVVAILNPLDAQAISQVEREAKGKKISLVLVTPSDMEEALRNYQKRIASRIDKLLE